MFQFHQNNSQLLFHVIVSPWGAGAFSRGFTKFLARQCRAFSWALKIEKLKAPLFPGPGGAGGANDWCITVYAILFMSKNDNVGDRCDTVEDTGSLNPVAAILFRSDENLFSGTFNYILTKTNNNRY